MITRAHRFHGFTSLRPVYSRGATVRGSQMAVKYLLNPRRGSYRAAVVVSRKVHKSAVVRNRIRRRIYEVIRGLEPRLNRPNDIVVTVYSEQVADMPASELSALIRQQFKKAGLLAPPNQRTPTALSADGPDSARWRSDHAIVEPKEKT